MVEKRIDSTKYKKAVPLSGEIVGYSDNNHDYLEGLCQTIT
jgi:hypothetical protein